MYGTSRVGWLSRTQLCISISSAEAECMRLAECSKEAMFVYHVLEFLEPGKRVPPIVLREDNEGAICLAQNPLSSSRTKHIDVRYHYIRGLVKRDEVETAHMSSERQHADTPTKPLSVGRFELHQNLLLNSRRDSEGGHHHESLVAREGIEDRHLCKML